VDGRIELLGQHPHRPSSRHPRVEVEGIGHNLNSAAFAGYTGMCPLVR